MPTPSYNIQLLLHLVHEQSKEWRPAGLAQWIVCGPTD